MQFGNAKKWMRNDHPERANALFRLYVPILENPSESSVKFWHFQTQSYEKLGHKKRVARGKYFARVRLFNALEEAINERLSSYQINGKLFSLSRSLSVVVEAGPRALMDPF